MKIRIHQPVGFNETGGRSNNEDCIFPAKDAATTSDRLFLVCDGVGGEHKGEVASTLACQSLNDYFSQFSGSDITLEKVKESLDYTLRAFEAVEKKDPGTHGMATTLTLLYLQGNGVALAHLGDSRIYQIRNGKIIFKSKDHKWVNELIESGVITEEQAREHPKRNVITRVISAGRNDEPEFTLIGEVRPNDYFFMCSDGVLEQLYDELLEYHLRANPDNEADTAEILEVIKEECYGKTNDNFSAYLIKIASVESEIPLFQKTAIPEYNTTRKDASPLENTETNAAKSMQTNLILLAAILIFATGIFYWKKPRTDPKPVLPNQVFIEATDSSQSAVKQKQAVTPKEIVKLAKPIKQAKNQKSKDKQLMLTKTKPADSTFSGLTKLETGVAPKEDVLQKNEVPDKESIVKSEKSDLPEKLKKVEPKPVE